ncbi:hypothetical protein [Natronobeatus ordinarius]|uniref:hypothetical protein n=1 Tax=Natronobeatus ordinarius TaxID=2963433 RepID=UPI0020CC7339|nr:hypothetical protein [Natronobeatus ordinarius]
MTDHDQPTRRTVVQAAGALVGGSLTVGAATTVAGQPDEDEVPDELPADVAAVVPADVPTGVHQQAVTHRHTGWSIRVDMTSDDAWTVRGGHRLEAFCTVWNGNNMSRQATVWLVVGHDPQLTDQAAVRVPGRSTGQVDVGYQTYPVQQYVTFPIYVVVSGPGGYDWDGTIVEVYPAP